MSLVSTAEQRVHAGHESFEELASNSTIAQRAPIPGVSIALALKRAIDISASAVLVMLLSPVLAGTALAIRMTSAGPIFFRQQRYGLYSEPFTILKFRTMYVRDMDVSGVKQTRAEDPRVTPLGRLLRRTNLDELPQLFNVLRGDMSLVGPRPHVPGMRAGGMLYETLVPTYFERHGVRPGMTGLAQINELRGSTADPKFAKARVAYDIAYIRHWSLLLDLRILWTTFRTEVLRGTGI
jgi:lipopolysaccharide/colanic/teichoic acid biosynthesis glycosyltransferase